MQINQNIWSGTSTIYIKNIQEFYATIHNRNAIFVIITRSNIITSRLIIYSGAFILSLRSRGYWNLAISICIMGVRYFFLH